eukprot:COSAG01_NODE_12424_length_1742_cov_1.206330_3_plen_46_part_00
MTWNDVCDGWEQVHALLTRLGYDTGLDAGLIEEAAAFARSLVSSS